METVALLRSHRRRCISWRTDLDGWSSAGTVTGGPTSVTLTGTPLTRLHASTTAGCTSRSTLAAVGAGLAQRGDDRLCHRHHDAIDVAGHRQHLP